MERKRALLLLVTVVAFGDVLAKKPSCKTNRCGNNEHYEVCGTACPEKCSSPFKEVYACPQVCVSSCFCNNGYVRNNNGDCVRREDCNRVCDNENQQYYEDCIPDCKNTCEHYNNPGIRCACGGPGCFCKDGYVLRKDGQCVPPSQCDAAFCKANEQYYDCKPICNTCANVNNPHPICPAICISGCFCKPGYVQLNDKCVLPQDCPNQNCPKNEHYEDCGTSCPVTCKSLSASSQACTTQCVQGCFCDDGLVRNNKGICVPPSQCPSKQCPKNERFTDCVITCNDCFTKGNCNQFVCNPGCDCIPGYYRNDKGKCIPERKCPSFRCDGNEEVSSCVNPCNDCNLRGQCQFLVCNPGCDCKAGFHRDDTGVCIPEESCPKNCPINEHYEDCGSACPEKCPSRFKELFVCPAVCKKGCFCNKGLVRNNAGQCVPPSQCPPINACPANEHYEDCGTACPATCKSLSSPSQVCTKQCVQGCFCNDGLVRNKNGLCVSPPQCPPGVICRPGEVFKECNAPCEKSCNNLNPGCAAVCIPGCYCRNELVRNAQGNCINPAFCYASKPGSQSAAYSEASAYSQASSNSQG